MDKHQLASLLEQVAGGQLSAAEALQQLHKLPFEDVGIARVDHHRSLRQGVPEVIFGEGKTAVQILAIFESLAATGNNVMATRLDAEKAGALAARFPQGVYHEDARIFTLQQQTIQACGRGKVLVACAGTSDLPVAREALVTARMLGNPVEELVDVGVSGLHRLLAEGERLRDAAVIIVVAGMEGALPSVVGGLVSVPVVAVPTSVGYGAAFGGVAALLGMLNSCASGVTVVNIDNGFGAAFAATRINRLLSS